MNWIKRTVINVFEERRSGRTTRIVDALIQELFTKGRVKCYDHYPQFSAHALVFEKVISRLHSEHGSLFRDKNNVRIDRGKLMISIVDILNKQGKEPNDHRR